MSMRDEIIQPDGWHNYIDTRYVLPEGFKNTRTLSYTALCAIEYGLQRRGQNAGGVTAMFYRGERISVQWKGGRIIDAKVL